MLALRDVEGWTSGEVSTALGISEATQRLLLHGGALTDPRRAGRHHPGFGRLTSIWSGEEVSDAGLRQQMTGALRVRLDLAADAAHVQTDVLRLLAIL